VARYSQVRPRRRKKREKLWKKKEGSFLEPSLTLSVVYLLLLIRYRLLSGACIIAVFSPRYFYRLANSCAQVFELGHNNQQCTADKRRRWIAVLLDWSGGVSPPMLSTSW
jgi:hypothetical protein